MFGLIRRALIPAPQTSAPLMIDYMSNRHIPEVIRIEEESFLFPWTEEELRFCLRHRNITGRVALKNNRVAGFMIYETLRRRLSIASLAVDPDERGEKVGSRLVQELTYKVWCGFALGISLHVRERNVAAQCFFRSQGMIATEQIRNHYEDTDEDAYVMEYQLG